MGHGVKENHRICGEGGRVNQRQSEARAESTTGGRGNVCEKENRKWNLKRVTLRHQYAEPAVSP